MKADSSANAAAEFLELLQPIQGELEAYCRRLIWDPQGVPDALHNALARAIGAFDRYHAGTNFRAWLYKILTHEVFAWNRKHGRIAAHEFQMEPEELASLADETESSRPSPADSLASWPDLLDQNLVTALKTLADEERATLLLRAMGGLKYQEIAEALNLPLGSVMGYLGRARKKMRLALSRRNSPQSIQ
jgi:RNA polymerase sigma-70 factor, ECF subfamily